MADDGLECTFEDPWTGNYLVRAVGVRILQILKEWYLRLSVKVNEVTLCSGMKSVLR